jgi:putative aldouronate transport system substrate-binding protein
VKNKLLALLLAMTMLLTVLSGCGSSSASTASAAKSDAAEAASVSEEAPEEEPQEEPEEAPEEAQTSTVEVTEEDEAPQLFDYELPITTDSPEYVFLVGLNPGVSSYIEDFSENQAISEWMSRTGINISFLSVHPSTASENFNLLLAADDLPDITDNGLDYYNGSTASAIEDGIFADIMEYADSCPNYMATISANDMIKKALVTDDGYMAAFYMMRTNNSAGEGMMVRQDWLDQVGLDVPTTYDEVYEVLTAFKNELGVPSPMLLNCSGTWSMGSFGWGYGMNGYMSTDPNVHLPLYVVDGQVKFAMMEDEYVDYLTMISQWYAEGLIESDIESVSAFQLASDYILNDETGYFYTASTMLSTYESQAVSDTFALSPAPQPVINEGDELHFAQAYDFEYEGAQALAALNSWTISATAEDIETLIQCLDYFFSPEGSLLANYGVEGVSFEYVDGEPTFTDLILANDQGMTVDNAIYIYTLQYGAFVEDYNRLNSTYTESQKQCDDTWTVEVENSYSYPEDFVSLTTEESETYSSVFSDISTVLSENILKFITGANSMDDYADFQQKLRDMGIDQIIEIYQDAYDRFMAR